MAKKKKQKIKLSDNSEGGIVYSTNSDFALGDLFGNLSDEEETIIPDQQVLHIKVDKKNRGGKVATLISNFDGADDELKDLAKTLKSFCGVGGAVKDGEIIIQGSFRDKITEKLESLGYRTKRVGG